MVIAFWRAKLCRYILMLYLIRRFLCYFDFPCRISLSFCCKLDMLLFSIILVWCLFPFTRFGFNEYVLQIFCRKKKTKSQPRSKLYYAVLQKKKKIVMGNHTSLWWTLFYNPGHIIELELTLQPVRYCCQLHLEMHKASIWCLFNPTAFPNSHLVYDEITCLK